MSDFNFEQWLGEFNDAYSQAEAYSDWMPDDGKHVVLIEKVDCSDYEKDGKTNKVWKLHAEIVAGDKPELIGQKFSWPLFSSAPGIIKGQAAKLNSGKEFSSGADAIKAIENCAGKVLDITVKTNEKGRTNVYIDQIVDIKPKQEQQPAEPPQG